MKYLKPIRIFLALLSIIAVTFLFVDVSGWATAHLDFMAKIQLVPALLALNLVAIAVLVVLTLVLGRVYCSVICPLGIFQDIVARMGKLFAGKRKRKVGIYSYKKPRTKTRTVFFALFLAVVCLGFLNVMALSLGALIEPYSAFGRMATALVAPVYDMGNNALADMSAQSDSYLFTPVSRSVSAILFVIAAVTLLVTATFAWRGGRVYCNTVCPVGSLLGFASKFAWLKIRIDNERCNGCGSCARHCKAECIDAKGHIVDYTRCVDCFDCIGACRQRAISFSAGRKSSTSVLAVAKVLDGESTSGQTVHTDKGRRIFLATVATATGAIVAKSAENIIEKTTDGGLTPLKKRPRTKREIKLLPPGVISQARLNAHCVGCQLCIQACPDGLLTMSTDFGTLMQPVLDFEKGYCKPECTACSNVCPTGVFTPLDKAMKTSWKIGTARVDLAECISATGTDNCGNCARHCPAGAIVMAGASSGAVPTIGLEGCAVCGECIASCPAKALKARGDGKPEVIADVCIGCGLCARTCPAETITMTEQTSNPMPIVNENICIGCGSCEVHCPVGTVASMTAEQPAIHVEGVSYQRII